MSETEMRVRVRPLTRAADWEVASAWTNQLCLSTPHVGEAIDFSSDAFRVRTAKESTEQNAKEGRRNPSRILHYGHELGRPCDTVEVETDRGRCLIVDYVPAGTDKSDDEVEVAGLVMAAKAG